MVTGGSAGLGLAITRRLLGAGVEVTIVDLIPPPEDLIGAFFELDLSANTARQDMTDLASQLGGLDILVANAGVVPPWRGLRDVEADEPLRPKLV